MIIIENNSFQKYISSEDIQAKVSLLATKINTDYSSKKPYFISVLDGSFMFTSDLLKKVTIPNQVSFVKIKSYENTESTGNINQLIGLQDNIQGKDIVILEDIVDTGKTMDFLVNELSQENPASISIATLVYKPASFAGKHIPNYVGFEISNEFIIGYGMDYNGYGRNLESIYQIKGSDPKIPLC